jgi:hypothetical protein
MKETKSSSSLFHCDLTTEANCNIHYNTNEEMIHSNISITSL